MFSYLTPQDLANIARLNTVYLTLAQENLLWQPLCTRWGITNCSYFRHFHPITLYYSEGYQLEGRIQEGHPRAEKGKRAKMQHAYFLSRPAKRG